MQRSIGIRWGSLSVGAILLVAIVALMYASMTGGGTSIFESKISFVCYFQNVNGLVKGSPVWMSGLEVGNVKKIGLEVLDSPRQVRVVCRVKKEILQYLTSESRIQLGTIGFLGDRYIEIIPGLDGGPPVAHMGVVATEKVGSAPAVFKAAEEATKQAGSVINNLDSILARMNAGEGTLGQLATNDALYRQLTEMAGNLTKLTAGLQQNQASMIKSIEHMSNSVGDLATQVNQNSGTLGKLVNDPALYDNLTATSARLDSILTKIDVAEGNLGLLVNDTGLYVELTNLLARANTLIKDIQDNPRDYFKFSVF